MTATTKHRANLTLIEVLIAVVLLGVAGFLLVRGMGIARLRAATELLSVVMIRGDRPAILNIAKKYPQLCHIKDSRGRTPLHFAASENATAVMELLLANGANINATEESGGTPLHWAVTPNSKEAVALLLSKGADVNLRDSSGWSALHFAANCDANACATLLLASGADPSPKDNFDLTPLLMAFAKGNSELFELLHKHGAKE